MLVGHRSNLIEIPAGPTIQAIMRHLGVPLNLSSASSALVNGHPVEPTYRPVSGDRVQFVEPFGRKGVGQQVWTDEEFCRVMKITREDLQAWIAQGLKVRQCLDGSLRITETAADEFFRGQVIESPYLTAEQAAKYIHTTVKGIYSLLERRKLQKLPGSRTILFTRELLDAYLQGGEE